MIYVNVDAPPGATLERSEAALNKVQAALLPLEEVETISTLAGYSLMTETEGASFGMGMINLTPWDQREQTAAELMSVYARSCRPYQGCGHPVLPAAYGSGIR